MPHGTPDWGLVGPRATVYGLDDLGEHAVRLGSPHLWDRRGDVVFATKFAEGLGDVGTWVGGGAGGSVVLHAGHSRLGAYCAKMTTDDQDEAAQILKEVPYPVLSSLGVEISFGCSLNTAYMELRGWLTCPAEIWRPAVRWDPIAGTIMCQTGALTWYTMTTTQPAYIIQDCCNTFKMVFDPINGVYVRVIANEQVYQLRAQPIYRTVPGMNAHFIATVEHHSDPGINETAYVDCFIVTQNEP